MRRIRKPCSRFRSGTPVRGSGGSKPCPLSTPKASKARSRTRRPDGPDGRNRAGGAVDAPPAQRLGDLQSRPRSSDPPQPFGVFLPPPHPHLPAPPPPPLPRPL